MSSGSVADAPGVGGGAKEKAGDLSGDGIAGLATLKGLVLYGAVLTFAGLYVYFAVKISSATTAPNFGTTLTGAAAALAGILGSAFALEIGVPSGSRPTNQALKAAVASAGTPAAKLRARVWQVFSIESSDPGTASWPKTFGIWVYAIVASGVAVTYVLNQHQTPDAIKALAVAFGGYVLALVNTAYRTGNQ
jgi:hypothetical protein